MYKRWLDSPGCWVLIWTCIAITTVLVDQQLRDKTNQQQIIVVYVAIKFWEAVRNLKNIHISLLPPCLMGMGICIKICMGRHDVSELMVVLSCLSVEPEIIGGR